MASQRIRILSVLLVLGLGAVLAGAAEELMVFDYRDADLHDVLVSMAKAGEMSLLVDNNVPHYAVTIVINRRTPSEALDMVSGIYGLRKVTGTDGVIRIDLRPTAAAAPPQPERPTTGVAQASPSDTAGSQSPLIHHLQFMPGGYGGAGYGGYGGRQGRRGTRAGAPPLLGAPGAITTEEEEEEEENYIYSIFYPKYVGAGVVSIFGGGLTTLEISSQLGGGGGYGGGGYGGGGYGGGGYGGGGYGGGGFGGGGFGGGGFGGGGFGGGGLGGFGGGGLGGFGRGGGGFGGGLGGGIGGGGSLPGIPGGGAF